MKKKLLTILTVIGIGSSMNGLSQYCAGGPSSTADSNIEGVSATGENATSLTYTGCPGVTGVEDQTAQTIDYVINATYSIDVTFGTCGGNFGGAGEAWIDFDGDQVYDPATESIGQSSGTPGTAPWDAPVTFTFTVPCTAVPGVTRIRINQEEGGATPLDPCATYNWGSSVEFSVNLIAGPSAPPTPVQDPAPPSCATGSDLTLAGPPPAGIEWYWQGTDANGTSTADVGTDPYTVFTNGTYYARAFDPNTGAWSCQSSSITVSNFALPSAPPAPVPDEDPACELDGGTNLTVAAAPAGEEYYWQGTNPTGTSQADPATSPYPAPTAGTYYVASYDPVTQCWSSTSSVTVTMGDFIPNAPTPVDSFRTECSGSASILLEGEFSSSQSFTYTIDMFDSFGDGWNGNTVDIFADGNLIATVGGTFTGGSAAQETFTVPEGVELTTSPAQGGSFTTECSYDILDENLTIVGSGDGNSGITPYNVPFGTYTMNWYDSATGGTLLGTGLTLEAVGTSVMPSATVGTYTFYLEQSNGCESSRDSVVVEVVDVNVVIAGLPVNCNGSATGSFEVTDTLCGVTPFQYSVDGGAFGPIPTDLLPGTYNVVVQDDNLDLSSTYTFTVNDVNGPQNLVMNDITSDGGEVGWDAGASETQWIVEWGAPGFTPGMGTEIGSTTVTDTFAIITGLDPNTDYDVYVAADCGSGSTTEWGSTSFLTLCSVFTAPVVENFDDGDVWVSGIGFGNTDDTISQCWGRDPGNGGFFWGVRTGTTGSGSTGPSQDVSGNGNYLFTEGSNGVADDSAFLYSPEIDLSNITDPYVTFSYHMFGGDIDSLTVYASNDNGFSWDTIGRIYGQQQTANTDAWLDTSFSLSAYTNDTVSIAFLNVKSTGFETDIAVDEFSILPCIGDAGADGSEDVCRLDTLVDLNNVITINQTVGGRWEFPLDQDLIVNDTMLNVLLLPTDSYEVYYIVPGACQEDTAVATINVYPPSSAGQNGSLTVCLNEPINLFDGLNGNVDLGGTWYDPSNDPLPNSQPTASNIPGSYNYDYVTSNGVCPADTALVEVIVDGGCDWLSIGEEELNEISVYPNPATNVINVVNPANTSALKVEIFDVNGRVVASDDKALENSTEGSISIDHLETGIYTLRVYGENGQKTFKIVKK